jgi:hypothetical protein
MSRLLRNIAFLFGIKFRVNRGVKLFDLSVYPTLISKILSNDNF